MPKFTVIILFFISSNQFIEFIDCWKRKETLSFLFDESNGEWNELFAAPPLHSKSGLRIVGYEFSSRQTQFIHSLLSFFNCLFNKSSLIEERDGWNGLALGPKLITNHAVIWKVFFSMKAATLHNHSTSLSSSIQKEKFHFCFAGVK